MKATIIDCIVGVLGFNETNELIDCVVFPKDPKKIAEKLAKVEAGRIIDELKSLVEKLKEKGYTVFVFENAEVAQTAHEKLNIVV